ncbi:MAG: hypothetical protein GY758_33430 [Fuerstiella sp.]|nr:hypothetical protein [Fuerstiella sp.]MCP4507386.1 hypothetical protein [Fuerstiella sp.]
MRYCNRRDQRKSLVRATTVPALFIVAAAATGAEPIVHGELVRTPTTVGDSTAQPVLRLTILNHDTAKFTPARFSLTVDGRPYFPEALSTHGLRFKSIHEAKKQVYVVLYSRGTGPVDVSLPADAKRLGIAVAKGFEFLPVSQEHKVRGEDISADISLQRWTNQSAKGWSASDAHLHYDRHTPAGDKDWLTMLAGDGLAQAHFMVLKGGKVPGIWARQYKYGTDGEASDGKRLIRSGEEYRDSAQGHINLLG